ncbi:hypothetical protein FC72_GL000783 [Companilactobacillus tucceti DSM 20183]|uniref:Membrane-bound protein n=1 Tax=Companilactobacillus tucceti DSM 20183 TaxID=1423811 RepID=A0A0R1IYH1_9LACO|nr:DUF1129 family protein [Companilactobacillus tucceti]KRK64008.1 hypothetical protein FC72_GL000783 [Companilactobacillus tucceti DSM 20183]
MSDDIRKKNQKAAVKQKEKAAKQEKQELTKEKIQSTSIEDLRKNLTNKNEEYVFKLNKKLIEGGFTEDEAKESVDNLIREIVENQIIGVPANQLYGPVTKKAGDIAHPVKPKKKTPYWALGIDTSLLFLTMFGLLYGVVALTNKKQPTNQTGILTLLILSFLWGYLLTWFNMQMRKPKNERPGWLVTIGYLVAGLAMMMVFLGLAQAIPTVINPSLDGIGYLIVAAVAFGARFVYRKLMDIHERSFF